MAATLASATNAEANRWMWRGPEGGEVTSIAVDRTRGGLIAYAVVNRAIFKTIDAGAHWRRSGEGVTGVAIFSIIVAPDDPLLLYAAGLSGSALIFKSTDGGERWTAIPAPAQLHGRALLAVSGNTLIVANESAVDRSSDDGQSWQRTFTSTIAGQAYCCISSLMAHPRGSLFLLHRAVHRSRDGGRRWDALRSAPQNPVLATMDTDGTIYVANLEVGSQRVIYRSRDEGETWSRVFAVDGPVRSIHAVAGRLYVSRGFDPEELGDLRFSRNSFVEYDGARLIEQPGFAGVAVNEVVPAGPGRLFAGTAGAGILTRTNATPEWIATNRGLRGTPVEDIAVSPVDASVVYAESRAGLLKSDDAGATWRRIGDAGWQVVSVSPSERDVAYVATVDGVKKTIDGGTTFTVVHETLAGSVTVARSNPDIIYAALFDGMSTSRDGGRTWTRSNAGITIFNRDGSWGFTVHAPVVVDSRDHATAYLPRDEALYKTTNGGASWSPILTSRMAGVGFADFWGHTVFIDPLDPQTLYVTGARNGGQVSRDGGSTWAFASFPAGVRELVFDPVSTNVVYAVDSGAVYRSEDRGLTFVAFSDGLEGVSVQKLTIDASGNVLYAATSHGVYSLQRDLHAKGRRRNGGR